ncbi:hairy and enhancer of split 5, gene 9 [Xenopus tropicalis]|uniref:Transcription factor HES-5 n=1 Tax=Xenopus tropicalis TaxID=8364 RepID=Q28JA3_XENTR|nr:hairy and enhancer of split 5, gene 9 [Xenopus tropicalis]CAJ82792.1 novel helix-loop-helix DNA binding domain protein [Xenopus tropicalis]|eukprot:NP_001037951.1 novel helix-loop-helix DNA binding domain protein [Xenopus tropicalis]
MAPYSNRMHHMENNIGKDMRKMRKPVVEKMRRDRINSSIEQLRMLLEKEFESHHLPSKPEKADILEVAVSLLRQQLQIMGKPVPTSKHIFPASTAEHVEFFTSKKHTVAEVNLLMKARESQKAGENTCWPMAPSHLAPTKQPSLAHSNEDLWRPW